MERKRENPVNKKGVQNFGTVQTFEYGILGKYIPVHRYDKKTHFEKQVELYEGDYERKNQADKKQIYQSYLKNLILSIKLIFTGRIK